MAGGFGWFSVWRRAVFMGGVACLATVLVLAGCGEQTAAGSNGVDDPVRTPAAWETSAAPHGRASAGAARAPQEAPPGPYDLALGSRVFHEACVICHGTGKAGTTALAEGDRWQGHTEQGLDVLIQHALGGHRGMPPRGGFADLSDNEVAAAVAYVVDQSTHIITRPDDEGQAEGCDPRGDVEGCSLSQMKKLLVLHMLRLLAGRH